MIVNSRQFDNLVKEGKVKPRPIGVFERGGYMGPIMDFDEGESNPANIRFTAGQREASFNAAKDAAKEIASGALKLSPESAALVKEQQRR